MTQYSTGNTGKNLNEEWHLQRWIAESEYYSIKEFDDIDIEQFDLDEVEFTRKFKKSEDITDTRLESEGSAKSGVNIKTISDIRD